MEPIVCTSCGHRIEDPGVRTCPSCGEGLAVGATPGAGVPRGPDGVDTGGGAAPPPTVPPSNSVPFEDTSQPFWARLFRTFGMAFTDPGGLFSGMVRGDIGLPLVYGVIVGTVMTLASLLWHMAFFGLATIGGEVALGEFAVGVGFYVLLAFLSPFFAALGLFVSSAIYHVALLVLGDGERGFSVTFRAVAYGNTPSLLGVVPFCGGIVGALWALVLVILGGKLGHGTDWWRAILAYFLPIILCCCLVVWVATTFGLLGALSDLG